MGRMIVLFSLFTFASGLLWSEEGQDSLSSLVTEALQNNPGIKAQGFQVKSQHAMLKHAWYLEPPEVGVDFFQTPTPSFPNPLKNQMEIDYFIKQGFPFPGTIRSRIRVDQALASMSESELEVRKRKMIREVKSTYFEIYLLDKRLKFNYENQTLLQKLIENTRRQYEVGMGRQSDILGAQTEFTKLKSDSLSILLGRRSMEAMLNSLLNRKTNRPIQVTDTIIPYQTNWSMEEIQSILKRSHPELQGMQANIKMREAEKVMASKELLPEIMIGGMFKDMLISPPGSHSGEPENYWSVMASMNIPFAFWSLPKFRAQNAQNSAKLEQARFDYQDTENMLHARAYASLLRANSNLEILRLNREILLPQAQHSLESNLSAYQGGKGEFMSIIDAYRMRIMAKENYEMAFMQLLVSQADLEEAVGISLEQIEEEISRGALK